MILITGGAGYIGSATTELLRSLRNDVVVLDNLSRGHRSAVPADVPFYQGDVGNRELLAHIAREHNLDACIHFAALAYVGESVAEPARYYENNVEQGIALLDGLLKAGVRRVVFSSTCAVYGEPQETPISELHPRNPTSPYGWSKLFMERILESYDHAYGLKFVALRYFNAAGATESRGECHHPETHLIPNVIAAAEGRLSALSIFGNDYPTRDGTAVRDYVHVTDLASAHGLALEYLRAGGRSEQVNLGNGNGHSVLEAVEAARRVIGRPVAVNFEPRRPGDPSHLVADAAKARTLLNWEPRKPQLDDIIRTDWEWRGRHPDGYAHETPAPVEDEC